MLKCLFMLMNRAKRSCINYAKCMTYLLKHLVFVLLSLNIIFLKLLKNIFYSKIVIMMKIYSFIWKVNRKNKLNNKISKIYNAVIIEQKNQIEDL